MPTSSLPSVENDAASLLDQAFSLRDRYSPGDFPCVGVFGAGAPETLIAASGACPIHVEFGTAEDGLSTAIDDVIEPFVDAEVRLFLNRLVRGDFADMRGIIFARDDAPAMIAYQYANEWLRQRRVHGGIPPLFLWNLVHTDTAPVRQFNQVQAQKLIAFLESVGLWRPTAAGLAKAAEVCQARDTALQDLAARRASGLSAVTAMRWRNAGRFMTAKAHAEHLERALSQLLPSPPIDRPLIGIVGSPLLSERAYAMFDKIGVVAADLHPWGDVWPGAGALAATLDDCLVAIAADPSCHRIVPTSAYREALLAQTATAQCDVVICQLAQTDDTIGWDVPALSAALAARGTAFVNLGFRDPEPDGAWLEEAAAKITSALEARR